MIYLYTCIPCREDNHDDCEIGYPAPEGTLSGGSRCRCACHGRADFEGEKIMLFDEDITKTIIEAYAND